MPKNSTTAQRNAHHPLATLLMTKPPPLTPLSHPHPHPQRTRRVPASASGSRTDTALWSQPAGAQGLVQGAQGAARPELGKPGVDQSLSRRGWQGGRCSRPETRWRLRTGLGLRGGSPEGQGEQGKLVGGLSLVGEGVVRVCVPLGEGHGWELG